MKRERLSDTEVGNKAATAAASARKEGGKEEGRSPSSFSTTSANKCVGASSSSQASTVDVWVHAGVFFTAEAAVVGLAIYAQHRFNMHEEDEEGPTIVVPIAKRDRDAD